jgi:isopenicillin-N epimerase
MDDGGRGDGNRVHPASHDERAVDLRPLFLLRDDVVYLNHGSFGACPRPVFAVYQELQRELESEPVDFLALERTFPQRMRQARAKLAAFVGAERDELVFVPNATTGLNVIARSLYLEPGDEVLTCDHEYGALDRTWRFLCGKVGARYIKSPLPLPLTNVDRMVASIWNCVTDRTRVLFLSHVTSPTGLILPVAELVRRAREAGIVTVIDGAHVPGQLDLDLTALGADFYAGNCHKWLMAPKGAAFLYARANVQPLVEPLIVSWGWESDEPGPSRFVDEQEWTGTRDPAAQLAVPAAIDFFAQHDWPAVRERCHELLLETRTAVTDVTGLEPICPAAADWFVQMHTLPLPEVEPLEFQRALRQQFAVEIPVFRFARRTYLRVSIQGYNSAHDVAVLVDGVRTLLK